MLHGVSPRVLITASAARTSSLAMHLARRQHKGDQRAHGHRRLHKAQCGLHARGYALLRQSRPDWELCDPTCDHANKRTLYLDLQQGRWHHQDTKRYVLIQSRLLSVPHVGPAQRIPKISVRAQQYPLRAHKFASPTMCRHHQSDESGLPAQAEIHLPVRSCAQHPHLRPRRPSSRNQEACRRCSCQRTRQQLWSQLAWSPHPADHPPSPEPWLL
mmetsp:Transcript_85095/g.244239  ORF Transcript_85095/g.244239 Transcript_85095/m.244239 type:complete len:215 (+) Transcript_85095:774-1418(+)